MGPLCRYVGLAQALGELGNADHQQPEAGADEESRTKTEFVPVSTTLPSQVCFRVVCT